MGRIIERNTKMTEEILNIDGSRNWQANILQDQVKRLEEELKQVNEDFSCIEKDYRLLNKQINALKQENKELKDEINKLGKKHEDYCNIMYWQMKEQMDKYRKALEEIHVRIINQNAWVGKLTECENEIFKITGQVLNEQHT